MFKLKRLNISLAAKCQLLFGLAVLVIIAGALAVPWQRMEQLAKQPNTKAARLLADVVFRDAHSGGILANGAVPPHPSGSAATPPPPGWDAASLSDANYPPPHIDTITPDGAPLPGRTPPDRIAQAAIETFRSHPQTSDYGEVETLKEPGGEVRMYRYAAAIRLDASCIACHSGAAWMPASARATPMGSAPAGTWPASAGTRPTAISDTAAAGAEIGPVIGVVRVDVPYLTDENQLLLNRIVIVVAGMMGGALAIVVFYLITSRLILQPVRVLKNTAEKVAGGDLNIRSAISTGDEFQHLSETFNTMLANLKASRDQLEATNRSLDTRVGELAQSNVDLYEANRVKSEFLTNVTHELRTPLNAIIGFADLLAENAGRGGDAKQQRYSENIRTSAKQLLDLINDLLDLAKIEAGKLVLREEKVNVADVCEAMANFMRPLAQKKNITLDLFVDPQMPLMNTDPGRFQQILYNFLSNAIKFTPNDGQVGIAARWEPPAPPQQPPSDYAPAQIIIPSANGSSARHAEGFIRISITDTGPGISPDDQKVIFEKFRQLDGSVTRHHSGSGLGLAISRELAYMLGGRIEVDSTPGKGAAFSLIIPVAARRSGTVEVHATLENA